MRGNHFVGVTNMVKTPHKILTSMPDDLRRMVISEELVPQDMQHKTRLPKGQIKRFVLEVLEVHPEGLDALSILSKINEK